jgi:hypothetical protein
VRVARKIAQADTPAIYSVHMYVPRASAAVAVVAGAICGLGGCGETSSPVRVPKEYANPPRPVPCPRQPPSQAESGQLLPGPGSFDTRILIGKSERDAVRLALEHGCTVRVAVRDGEGQVLTGDEQFDRVDVYVEARRIVGVRPS